MSPLFGDRATSPFFGDQFNLWYHPNEQAVFRHALVCEAVILIDARFIDSPRSQASAVSG
jgi:hypothetical protein